MTTGMLIDLGNPEGVLIANGDVVVFGGYPLASYIGKFLWPVTAAWAMADDLGVIAGPLPNPAHGSGSIAGGVTH